jgi:hypothetical protein
MTVSIPLLMLIAIVVYVAWRHMGLRIWHAVACLVLGFLLASTGAAPEINNALSGILRWVQSQFAGGRG